MINTIKTKIKELYESNTILHLTIHDRKMKAFVQNAEVIISAIYPSIFQVTEYNVDSPKTYSIQYVEILMHSIQLKELDEIFEQPKITE